MIFKNYFCIFISVLLILGGAGSHLALAEEFWPGTRYESKTPTLMSLYGYEAGTELTTTFQIESYLKALEKVHPANISINLYGQSWQGRRLNYAVISSSNNIQKLQQLKQAYRDFADPRKTSKSDMKKAIEQLPAIVWLGYGVHGNEVSSPDAALQVAYHLLAAKDDVIVKNILDNVIVILDPIQNPDGREKFIHHYNNNRGPEANGFAFSTERKEGWNTGRSNHYIFDLNRDWAAMTQPETQGRVKLLSDWLPLVAVDVHEFGSDYTYFFTPEADPYNPYITDTQKQSLEIIGKNNAKWFDKRGWRYFTREIYDAFFPGYGAGWPVFYGALGMTYEQASPRGLKATNTLGETFTYKDAMTHHFVASISTLQAVAENKKVLMQRFWEYRANAVQAGKKGKVKQVILSRAEDAFNTDKLAHVLASQGIELGKASQAFSVCDAEFEAGDYVVDMAQPNYRMIRNYLDQRIPMETSFIDYQENLKRLHKNHVLYDVTAWSKRLTYNADVTYCDEKVKVAVLDSLDASAIMTEKASAKAPEAKEGGLAWLVNWQDTGSAHFMISVLREGIEVWSTNKAFTQKGHRFEEGSLIIYQNQKGQNQKGQNQKGQNHKGQNQQEHGLADKLIKIARQFDVELVVTDTSWVDEGVNFGSQHVVKMKSPNVALLWDRPVSAYLAGATRFVFERTLNHPVTAIATRNINSIDFTDFDVLVLPGGKKYDEYFTDLGLENLRVWLRQGGVLMAIGSAIQFTNDNGLSVLTKEDNSIDKPDVKLLNGNNSVITGPQHYEALQTDANRSMEGFPGVILKAIADTEHWMTVGIDKPVYALASGNATWSPLNRGQGVNVAHFSSADDVLASGYLWQGYEKQLAYKPFLTVENFGDGMVVSYTESPTFRAHLPGLEMLFINSVWRSVAHTTANIRNGR